MRLPSHVRRFTVSIGNGQPLVVGVMDRQGTPGVRFDVEGSGYGFRVVRQVAPAQAEMPHACRMVRPERH